MSYYLIARSAANQLRSRDVAVEAVTAQYLAWIEAQDDQPAAARALEVSAATSKRPEAVIRAAGQVMRDAPVPAGPGEGGGGGGAGGASLTLNALEAQPWFVMWMGTHETWVGEMLLADFPADRTQAAPGPTMSPGALSVTVADYGLYSVGGEFAVGLAGEEPLADPWSGTLILEYDVGRALEDGGHFQAWQIKVPMTVTQEGLDAGGGMVGGGLISPRALPLLEGGYLRAYVDPFGAALPATLSPIAMAAFSPILLA